jgi:serine protease Do
MKRFMSISLIFAGLIIGLILSANLDVQQLSHAKESGVNYDAKEFLGKFNTSLSGVAEAVKPSVVNISTTKTVNGKGNSFEGFPDDLFFRRFFGDRFKEFDHDRKHKTSALGSGVIVAKDGYILTNNHVVKDADKIKVILYDKKEYKGQVIGTDPKTDLAVIKIDAKDLPAIKIGDSDTLKVGEMVIAIGNPFALNHTITMGIVSAIGRSNVGIADYEDFIQTDAAINPGNSGGALVNIDGELVGINTAIFSTNGGYMGIGFAIPTTMVNSVMDSIIAHGKVVRGWLGVTIQNLTPELAGHFDISENEGSLVTDVVKDSPAEKAGFERGDLVVDVEGKTVKSSSALRNMVAKTAPGKTVEVTVIRDGKEKTLRVKLGEFPDETMLASRGEDSNAIKGVHVRDLTPDLKKRLDIPEKVNGVVVTNVEGDSAASGVLRQNDVIQEINRKDIKNIESYEEAASRIESEDSAMLLVYRGGGYIYVAITS